MARTEARVARWTGAVHVALRNSLELARHVERWGYPRFWLAAHHGMPGVASAATAVVIGHVAAGTSRSSSARWPRSLLVSRLVETGLDLEAARAKFRINARAGDGTDTLPDFSARIRRAS